MTMVSDVVPLGRALHVQGDSTVELWGYLSHSVVDDGDNSYLRLDVRPTRTATSLIVMLVVVVSPRAA